MQTAIELTQSKFTMMKLDGTSDFIIFSYSAEFWGYVCGTDMFLSGWGLGGEGGFCYDTQKGTWRNKDPETKQEPREVWEDFFEGITLLLFEEYSEFNIIMWCRNFLAEGREL